MALSDDSVRQIAKVLRKHVASEPLDHIINDLLEIRGDKDFRDTRREARARAADDL